MNDFQRQSLNQQIDLKLNLLVQFQSLQGSLLVATIKKVDEEGCQDVEVQLSPENRHSITNLLDCALQVMYNDLHMKGQGQDQSQQSSSSSSSSQLHSSIQTLHQQLSSSSPYSQKETMKTIIKISNELLQCIYGDENELYSAVLQDQQQTRQEETLSQITRQIIDVNEPYSPAAQQQHLLRLSAGPLVTPTACHQSGFSTGTPFHHSLVLSSMTSLSTVPQLSMISNTYSNSTNSSGVLNRHQTESSSAFSSSPSSTFRSGDTCAGSISNSMSNLVTSRSLLQNREQAYWKTKNTAPSNQYLQLFLLSHQQNQSQQEQDIEFNNINYNNNVTMDPKNYPTEMKKRKTTESNQTNLSGDLTNTNTDHIRRRGNVGDISSKAKDFSPGCLEYRSVNDEFCTDPSNISFQHSNDTNRHVSNNNIHGSLKSHGTTKTLISKMANINTFTLNDIASARSVASTKDDHKEKDESNNKSKKHLKKREITRKKKQSRLKPNMNKNEQSTISTKSISSISTLVDDGSLRGQSFVKKDRDIVPLGSEKDDLHISPFLTFLRRECLEVFTASKEDVKNRLLSKKVNLGQVGIRCRFCAHLPAKKRASRSSAFPSSTSGLYQSVLMMNYQHFANCTNMPIEFMMRYESLKKMKKRGGTDSRQYWIQSARELGMVDVPEIPERTVTAGTVEERDRRQSNFMDGHIIFHK